MLAARDRACAWSLGSVTGERREQLPRAIEDREVAVAGVDVQLRGRYRLGIAAGGLQRHGGIYVPVEDRCWRLDRAEFETPGLGEHPQVLSDSPAAPAERLEVVGYEGFARAGLSECLVVDVGQRGCGQVEK